MRKIVLDEHAETHRAGSRIILRESSRYFGLADYDLTGSREELHNLDRVLRRTIERFSSRSGKGVGERCRIQLGFYPQPSNR